MIPSRRDALVGAVLSGITAVWFVVTAALNLAAGKAWLAAGYAVTAVAFACTSWLWVLMSKDATR